MAVVNDNNFWGGAIDYAKNKIAQIKQNMMCMWDIITWFGGGGGTLQKVFWSEMIWYN